jgi:hypothetical protein
LRARLEGHGFEGSTDWVSPGANTLARRETDLLEQRLIPHRSVEDVDDSYSIIKDR